MAVRHVIDDDRDQEVRVIPATPRKPTAPNGRASTQAPVRRTPARTATVRAARTSATLAEPLTEELPVVVLPPVPDAPHSPVTTTAPPAAEVGGGKPVRLRRDHTVRPGPVAPAGTTAAGSERQPLWTSRQLGVAGAVMGAGAIGLIVAWDVAAGRRTLTEQATPLNLAVVCLILVASAGGGLLLMARRSIGLRRRRLLGEASPSARDAKAPAAPAVSDRLVAGKGLKHFHREDCPLARGRGFVVASRADHQRGARTACGVCRP